MHGIVYNQILILVLQCVIAGGLILTLFRLRSIFGLSLLFIILGIFQFIQVFLYSSLYFEITPSVIVTPGTILFAGSLSIILLIYIRDGALEARKVIYAIVIANIILVLLQYIISLKIEGEGILNIYHFPKELFIQEINITLVGIFALLIDVFIIIFIYEIIVRLVSPLFLRIFFSTAIVLSIDSLLFNFAIYYGTDQFLNNLYTHLITKISSAFIYSNLFTFYLIYLDKKYIVKESKKNTFKNVFSALTFRQKFVKASIEKEKMEHELSETKNYLQTIFDATTDSIFIHDGKTGKILDVNQQMCDQFGYTKEEVLQNDMQSLSSDIYPYTKEEANKWLQKVKNEGQQTFEWHARHKDGHVFWVEVSIKYVTISGKPMYIATSRNIEKRKEIEKKLNKSSRLFEIISQMNMAVTNIRNQKMLLEKFCDIIIETGKFKLAWIGFINTEKQSISPYASAGDSVNYLNNFKIDLTDKAQSKGPTALAISNKNSVVFNDLENSLGFKFWSKKAEKYDFKSVIAIPIIEKNKVIGNINIYDSEVLFFDVDEIELLEKTSLIISLALQKINEEIIRKQVEIALQKSENRYRYFVEQTSEGFYQMASEKPIPLTLPISQQINWMYKYMYVTECNDVYAKLYGYKKTKEIIGKRFIELHGDKNDSENRNTLTSFITSNYKVVNATTKEITSQGEIKYFSNNAVGIIENNCLIAFWGAQIDVSPQKTIEAKLQESYKIINRSPAVAFLWKKEENWPIEYVSENVQELTEYSVDDFLTQKISYFNIIHKDDIEQVTNEVAKYSEIDKLKSFSHKPYKIVTKSGEIKWVNDNSVIRRNENNEITHFEGLVIDITENKLVEEKIIESERKLKEAQKIAHLGYWELNLITNKLKWSDEVYRIFGLKPQEFDATYEAFLENIHPDDREKVNTAYLNSLKRKTTYEIEHRLLLKSGELKYVIEKGATIFDENGVPQSSTGTVYDITNLKKAENEIRVERNKAQQYLDVAGVILLSLNFKGNVQLINPKGCEILGYTKNEILGKNWFDNFIPLKYRNEIKEVSKKVFLGELESAKYYENTILTKSGEERLIAWQNELIKNINGEITGVLSSGEDITERKKALDKIKQYASIVAASSDMMSMVDKNYRYVAVNESYLKAYKLSENRIIGFTISDIFEQEFFETKLKPRLDRCLNGEYINFQNWVVFPAYGKKFMDVNYYPYFDENKNINGIVVNARDITDKKLAQQELQNFANRLKLLHNVDKSILAAKTPQSIANNVFPKLKKIIPYKLASLRTFNPETQKIITIATSFELPLNNKVQAEEIPIAEFDFVDIKDLTNGNIQIIKNFKTIKSKSFIIEELIKNNINIIIIIPLMVEGEYVGALNLSAESTTAFSSEMIEIAKEIANQLAISLQQWKLREEILVYTKELESKVEERTKELAHSNSELRDFAQIVSHDLKAPLRAISQLSYWLSKDYADKIDEEGQEQLNLLIGRVQRLDNLIEGILQFSRIGKAKEKDIKINLNNLVKDTIEMLNPPGNIHIKVDTELPEIIADPTRIGQLFQNLIQNAIKFMDKPTGFINIGMKEMDNFYEFYVKDNGCGIDNQYFDRIFKIFQRLVSRDEQEGTGIGLSLVKRIAQIYGGDVWLTSKVDEGTTFYVTFPKNKENN